MATTKKKSFSNAKRINDISDFYCACGMLKQWGDTARLAQLKKDYPAEYAVWEKRQANKK